jgi:hypothetical protein
MKKSGSLFGCIPARIAGLSHFGRELSQKNENDKKVSSPYLEKQLTKRILRRKPIEGES